MDDKFSQQNSEARSWYVVNTSWACVVSIFFTEATFDHKMQALLQVFITSVLRILRFLLSDSGMMPVQA